MHVPDWLKSWKRLSLHVPPHHAQLFAPPSLYSGFDFKFTFSSANLRHFLPPFFAPPPSLVVARLRGSMVEAWGGGVVWGQEALWMESSWCMSYDISFGVLFCRVSSCPSSLVLVHWRHGLPGRESSAVQPGHQPDSTTAGSQRPGGQSYHPLSKVGYTFMVTGTLAMGLVLLDSG